MPTKYDPLERRQYDQLLRFEMLLADLSTHYINLPAQQVLAKGAVGAADATSTDTKCVLMLFSESKHLPVNMAMEEAVNAEVPNNGRAGTNRWLQVTP